MTRETFWFQKFPSTHKISTVIVRWVLHLALKFSSFFSVMSCLLGRILVPTIKSVCVIVRHNFSMITVLKWHSIINMNFVLCKAITRLSVHCNLQRKSYMQTACWYLYNPTRLGVRNLVANRCCRRQRLLGNKVRMWFITYSLQWKQYRLPLFG